MHVNALLFDVFGTLVDWRTSLIEDLGAFGRERGIAIDWAAFVDDWRGAYEPSMDRVRRGETPWVPLDVLHGASFDELATRFGIAGALRPQERAWCIDRWHRLRPWPDTVAGLAGLRERYITGSLSNGNVRLLVDLAREARLGFDVIFSAETFRHYKPDAEVYRGAVEMLGVSAGSVMLVAAHNADLRAAASLGMRTAFVARPAEYGPRQHADFEADASVDVAASTLVELAAVMCT